MERFSRGEKRREGAMRIDSSLSVTRVISVIWGWVGMDNCKKHGRGGPSTEASVACNRYCGPHFGVSPFMVMMANGVACCFDMSKTRGRSAACSSEGILVTLTTSMRATKGF